MTLWKRIAALCVSVSTVGVSMLSAGCENIVGGFLNSSQGNSVESSIEDSSSEIHTHEWTEVVVKEATCTEDGKKVLKCECGEEKDEEVIPAGHDLTRTTLQEASCTQEGLVEITCKNCEYKTQETQSKKDHLYLFGGDCFWCGKSKDAVGVIDPSKTVIDVASYNGGIGLEWMQEAAKRFEEIYKDVSFEEGKKGVMINVVEAMPGDMLANKSLNEDVYLTESVDYYLMLSRGKLADISDVVTADLGSYGESGKTIVSKMDAAMSSFLKAKDGKYYAIPFYDGFYGFIYDVDMFEGKGWFFDEAGNFTNTNKSTGLDGIAYTYDDGMPKTYAQFEQLVDKIRRDSDGITPFVYSMETVDYFIELLANYWATYEGKENMQHNWSLNGESNLITGWDGNTPIIEKKTITEENRFDLQKQAGKYYALQFMRDVVTDNGYNYISASDFKNAQFQLIQSHLDGEIQPNAVAMLVDGSWFENEAKCCGTFDAVAKIDLRDEIMGMDYKTTRRFAFMPIPMVDESCSTKQTLISSSESFCFINAETTGGKLDASKEFLKFLHTDAELCRFNAKTSITRPYTYTMSDENLAHMSYYGRSLLEMKESADIVYPYADNVTFIENYAQHSLRNWAWKSKVNGSMSVNPFTRFAEDGELTAKTYFEGLYNAYQG